MMKVLVTGVKGQLGYDVINCLTDRKVAAIGADITEFDITDFDQTKEYITENRPDAVIHCSAYTAVDKAEDEVEKCTNVNAEGTKNIASVCKELDIKMLYISTDYVFPGLGTHFYEVDDPTEPLSVYGKTKLQGEIYVRNILSKYFIVRTSWVFGKNGNNFVKTMLRLGAERDEINVVADQIGSPTYTKDLAKLLCDMIVTDRYGIYHATNEGICSWAEFAQEIITQAGLKANVNLITTAEYPTKARRPFNSRLSKESLTNGGFTRLPEWKDALRRYLTEIEIIQ